MTKKQGRVPKQVIPTGLDIRVIAPDDMEELQKDPFLAELFKNGVIFVPDECKKEGE